MPRPLPLFVALALSAAAVAQNNEEYGKKIREYTTEPFFLTELVDHLPASSKVPSPDKFLGHVVGAPNVLTYASQTATYFRMLEKTSPRVRVMSIGKSEEGREMVVAVISDETNLRKLDRLKQVNKLLGDPRKIKGEAQAEALIKEGVPMYWATGGMHATETGPPEMLMELAYRLAVSETPTIRDIRKNSVVMLTPVLDVDGRERVVDLYRYRKENPTKPDIPLVYWGHYVAHDDNRDGMVLSLELSKSIMRTWFDFYPTVFHDLHESVPFLYISTGTGPYNAWLDPIVVDEWHMLAYNEINEMTRRGVPGVWTHNFFDGWAPNYGFYCANGHNAIGRFYETFSGGGADTGIRTTGSASTRDWYRPNPPFPRVRWSIRNNVNMMQSALLLGMHKVAMEKEKFLRNYYLKSKRSIAKARAEGPAAWVLPASDANKTQQALLLKLLQAQGVEISQLGSDVDTADGKFGRGSYVVRMDQPYSRMADMMLDKQYYSATDPRSYDDTGWQLGPLFNVTTVRCKDVKLLDSPMSLVPPVVMPAKPFDAGMARIAIVHSWQSTQDEGWFRKAFDEMGVKFDYIAVQDVRDTLDLRAKYDFILIPPIGASAQSIVAGIPMVGDPISWKPLDGYPNLGGPATRDDIRGGIELQGMMNLQRFVNEGGTLACVGRSCAVPIDFGLVSGVSIAQPNLLNAPGGVYLAENVGKDSPVMAGVGDTLGVYFNGNSLPLLQVGGGGGGPRGGTATPTRPSGRGDLNDPDIPQGRPPYTPKEQPGDVPQGGGRNAPRLPQPKVLLRFAPQEKVLIAGMIDHPEELGGKVALVDCPVGKGHVLLFAMNPMWRMETIGSFPLIFNAARSAGK
jgi:hypothetical protein